MPPTIGDLIEVPAVKTVIRLDEAEAASREITGSFVFTGEVANHMTILCDAFLRDTGRGYFLLGDFGSGKSHFLAVLTNWFAGHPGFETLSDRHPGFKRLAEKNRRLLPVNVSLVNCRAGTPLERILAEAVEQGLAGKGVEACLSPLSVFFKRFSRIISESAFAGAFKIFLKESGKSDFELLRRKSREDAYVLAARFLKQQGVDIPDLLVEERDRLFARALDAVHDAGYQGMVLILDELSEFFRSKPNVAALNDDARMLQFIGEQAASRPVWVICAVQESIERTGDISQTTFRKIKDRFPVKLQLSTLHIRDLISKRLVIKKEGAAEEIYSVFEDFKAHFPSFSCDWPLFQSIYPIHPLTLSLLEGLGTLFSEHRGIVDFVYSRLAGDPARNISGILDRPVQELLTPDAIYEHFSPRLLEFSDFHAYPRHVVPHLDEVIDRIIDDEEDRRLVRRLVRILVLFAIHPTAGTPDVRTLTECSSCLLAAHDPDANVRFVAGALLDPLVEQSRYLVKEEGEEPLKAKYSIVIHDDRRKTLEARLKRAMADIEPGDSRLLLEPLSLLPQSAAWPGPDFLTRPVERIITWRRSSRRVAAAFLPEGGGPAMDRVEAMLAGGEADAAVLFTVGGEANERDGSAVWRIPCPDDRVKCFREFLAARMIAAELKPANPADAHLLPLIKDRLARLEPEVGRQVTNLIYSGAFSKKDIMVDDGALKLRRFDRLLESAGDYLLEKRFPRFKEIAPRLIAPTLSILQRLFDGFVAPGSLSLSEARSQGIAEAIESIVTPLGLVEVKKGVYRLAPRPDEHSFLNHVFSLLPSAGPVPLREIRETLERGPYGVPSDLLTFLLAALAMSGMVSLNRGGRTIALDFLRLASVETADTIAPGELLGQADRETLIMECPFLGPPSSFSSFGLRQQREAWQNAIRLKKTMDGLLAALLERINATAEYAAFAALDTTSLTKKLRDLAGVVAEIKISLPARDGLERFLKAWRTSGLRNEDLTLARTLDRFFALHAEQFVFIAHYVRHRAVEQAAAAEPRLADQRTAILWLLDDPLNRVIIDKGAKLAELFEGFRSEYVQLYVEAHREFAEAAKAPKLSRNAQRGLAVLERLSAIDHLDRPAGLDRLISSLTEPAAPVCRRHVREELLRSPVCGCDFIPGDRRKNPTPADPEALLDKMLEQYRDILTNPAVAEPLVARSFALKESKPAVAGCLQTIGTGATGNGSLNPSQLIDLVDEETGREIELALTGRGRIENRDLAKLRSLLAGRRLPSSGILDLVREWLGEADEDTVMALDDTGGREEHPGIKAASWWPLLRPDIFPPAGMAPGLPAIAARELERDFPSSDLKRILNRLDTGRLAAFIAEEPVYTGAIRAAWSILAERVLKGDTDKIPVACRHLDQEISNQCRRRLETLRAIGKLPGSPLPDRLAARLSLAALYNDPWTSSDLRRLAASAIGELARAGDEWLLTLPPLAAISLETRPLVIIVDAVPVDIWLRLLPMLPEAQELTVSWSRLETAALTLPATAALFGLPADSDPSEFFAARGMPYHQINGAEPHPLVDLIPPPAAGEAVIVRVGGLDSDIHKGGVNLEDLTERLGMILARHLQGILKVSREMKRDLILTTDHGLSWEQGRLSHGRGGVFERAIFRAEWRHG